MRKVKALLVNMLLLSLSFIAIRTIRLYFQVYLSKTMGASGLGLYQLIMSVNFFALTFASSAVRLGASRLVAEAASTGANVAKSVRVCIGYSMVFSICTSLAVYKFSPYIAKVWLGDARALLAIRIISLGLPGLAVSSVFAGYFTAVGKAGIYAITQLIEQFIKVFVTMFLLEICVPYGIEYTAAGAVGGFFIGETFSLILLAGIYALDKRRFSAKDQSTGRILAKLLKISLPVALSGYVTSSISTFEHLIVPKRLKKGGLSPDSALASYGLLHGMVLPTVMFPSVLIDTISDLILPELAGSAAAGGKRRINYITKRTFKAGIIFSVFVMFTFLMLSHQISQAVFGSGGSAFYMRLFALLIPVVYLDIIADSVLKGIGEQVHTMTYSIVESLISAGLIYFLLPKYGASGYVFVIFFGSILHFLFNMSKVFERTDFRIDIFELVKIIACMWCSLCVSTLLFGAYSLVLTIAAGCFMYAVFLRASSCITKEDFLWFKSIFKASQAS